MGRFLKKCLPPTVPYIDFIPSQSATTTTTVAPAQNYFFIPTSGVPCPPEFLAQDYCACGSLFIGKDIQVLIKNTRISFNHNTDVLLNNRQVLVITTSPVTISSFNSINIDLKRFANLKNRIQIVARIKETNQPLAYSIIGTDEDTYSINAIDLCTKDPLSLENQSIQLEFYSLCYSDDLGCCERLPSSITLTNSINSLPCSTTTTTTTSTTTTQPPFCSRFNLPNLFYVTAVGYGQLSGQEAVALVSKSGNSYTANGTFPCGASFTLSMVCDPTTETFKYDGSINCCDPSTKTVIAPTTAPLIFPGAVLPQIIFYSNCNNCPPPCTTTTTSTTQPPPHKNCCNWDGQGSFSITCDETNTFPIQFYKIDDNLFEANETLECGDSINIVLRCKPDVALTDVPDAISCKDKWEVIAFKLPCAQNFRLTGNLLSNCICDGPPIYEWAADDLSECGCCGPPFDVDWQLTWRGTINGNPWVITNNKSSIRFNIEDSSNCGGSNPNVQSGTATATITVGDKDVMMDIDFSGIAELEAVGFENISFYLNQNLIGSATSSGGNLECTMGPIMKTLDPQPQLLLAGQVYTFSINFTTRDPLYHIGSYYQIDLTFS